MWLKEHDSHAAAQPLTECFWEVHFDAQLILIPEYVAGKLSICYIQHILAL